MPADADALAALLRDNREFLAPFSPCREEPFFSVEGQRRRLANPGGQHLFAILDEGRVAGTVSISNAVYGPLRSANIGYWVSGPLNGRGLASRAVADAVETAFCELGLHRLEAGALVDNLASQRVLVKNGFERIGLARRYLHIGGDWRDHVLFQRVAV